MGIQYFVATADSCTIAGDTYQVVKGDVSLLSALPLTLSQGTHLDTLCLVKNPQTSQV